MKISVKEAFASDFYRKEYAIDIPGNELGELPALVQTDMVSARVTITAKDSSVMCRMHIKSAFNTICSRCAKNITLTFDEEFEKPVRTKDDGSFEDVIYTDNAQCIEIAEEIRTCIHFGFPAVPLCREDCKGLCPICGCDLNVQSCSCDIRTVDPRLAVLKELADKQ